jgi:abortive infection bacteriophage resistance protein
MTRYAKPPLSFEEQADQLLRRGMVGDRATIIARLSMINYYRLSAYWYPFRKPGESKLERQDDFVEGTLFETVMAHYTFDQHLRVLVLEAIERIEVATRTQLAYHHSRTWGADGYATNAKSLPRLTGGHRAPPTHAEFIAKLRENETKGAETPFVRHFRSKYTSSTDLPIWMAIELMSIGNLVTMFQGSREIEQNAVSSVFGVTNGVFSSWLLTLANVRNICAHHGRLWNRTLGKIPQLPSMKTHEDWYRPVHVGSAKLFTALTIATYLLGIVAPPSSWAKHVAALLLKHPTVPAAEMGFPGRWKEIPLWQRALT